jgi:DNA-binding CsgD family transcriptional regulator
MESVAMTRSEAAVAAEHVNGYHAGLLLFDTTPKLMYMDARARDLCGRINRDLAGVSANGVIPESITNLCRDIVETFAMRLSSRDLSPFELRRLVGSDDIGKPILLHGYAIPAAEKQEVRILIILEDVSLQVLSREVSERFRFTEREAQVVKNLAKGYTNKEIAAAVGSNENAVKEVVKRVMQKTKTTTRTGVMAQVLGL